MLDSSKRVAAIRGCLEAPDDQVTVEDKATLLEELCNIVDNIDDAQSTPVARALSRQLAQLTLWPQWSTKASSHCAPHSEPRCCADLHAVGGLQALVELLQSPHPQLRAGAAEVVAVACQGHAPVQSLFLDAGALPKLLVMLQDADHPACRCASPSTALRTGSLRRGKTSATRVCRTKALTGLSCLLRHSSPCTSAFAQAGGVKHVAGLVVSLAGQQREPEALAADDQRQALRQLRKCLQLLAYLAAEVGGWCTLAVHRHGPCARQCSAASSRPGVVRPCSGAAQTFEHGVHCIWPLQQQPGLKLQGRVCAGAPAARGASLWPRPAGVRAPASAGPGCSCAAGCPGAAAGGSQLASWNRGAAGGPAVLQPARQYAAAGL